MGILINVPLPFATHPPHFTPATYLVNAVGGQTRTVPDLLHHLLQPFDAGICQFAQLMRRHNEFCLPFSILRKAASSAFSAYA